MTPERLHDLLYNCAELHDAEKMSEIGDALVTTTIVDEDSTWAAPVEERILFGLCCILHHAGANGLDDMWAINEMASVATMASALEGLQLIGEKALYDHAMVFWNHMMAQIADQELKIPLKYSDAKRGDYADAENAIMEADYDVVLPANVRDASYAFLSVGDTSFPGSVLTWIRTFEDRLAARICQA
ncbi:hypothetical protein [Prosthecobacter vanneervenii]|uniref:Uncharacterized protein n=1 Tax=Prosthecobacter vanneervenii TaxID=48466 RepID=A0A7W7YDL3_9BACT|nr:hypothetical protein [Prosthecobacter vanneervenii]MBB5034077.1 hypothetical protein [Prosthecobacter vanneervenii]